MKSFLFLFLIVSGSLFAQENLPSWKEGPVKQQLQSFMTEAQDPNSKGFIPVEERVAVFDNDGTLWSEQPIYFQLFFAKARLEKLAETDPSLKQEQPFKAVLEGDQDTIKTFGEKEILEVVLKSHAGMSNEAFEAEVAEWIKTAKHPATGRRFLDMTYQPMKELIAALHKAEFKCYIVSGGGVSFMRPWVEEAYGIPRNRVVGSRIEIEYEVKDGKPQLTRKAKIGFVDDKGGKPVGIYQVIGRRPAMAFGNSDGDFEMLEYTTAGDGPRLGALVHHTDAEREWAYDRDSHVGHLVRGLDEAKQRGWVLIDMKRDWTTVFGE